MSGLTTSDDNAWSAPHCPVAATTPLARPKRLEESADQFLQVSPALLPIETPSELDQLRHQLVLIKGQQVDVPPVEEEGPVA